jgi:hypothetical protein
MTDAIATGGYLFAASFFNRSSSACIAFDCATSSRERTSMASIFCWSSISWAVGPVEAGTGNMAARGGGGGTASRRTLTPPCPAAAAGYIESSWTQARPLTIAVKKSAPQTTERVGRAHGTPAIILSSISGKRAGSGEQPVLRLVFGV